MIPLKVAYERFRAEPGAASNAYDWYRRDAMRSGVVNFGTRRQFTPGGRAGIPASKVGGQWMVDETDFEAAIAEHRAARAELEQITADFNNRILHGEPRATVSTLFGSYTRYVDFHSTCDSHHRPWKESGVAWYCSRCWQLATLAHDKEECHSCADWGGCGRDCTLSEVSCRTCGTAMAV